MNLNGSHTVPFSLCRTGLSCDANVLHCSVIMDAGQPELLESFLNVCRTVYLSHTKEIILYFTFHKQTNWLQRWLDKCPGETFTLMTDRLSTGIKRTRHLGCTNIFQDHKTHSGYKAVRDLEWNNIFNGAERSFFLKQLVLKHFLQTPPYDLHEETNETTREKTAYFYMFIPNTWHRVQFQRNQGTGFTLRRREESVFTFSQAKFGSENVGLWKGSSRRFFFKYFFWYCSRYAKRKRQELTKN